MAQLVFGPAAPAVDNVSIGAYRYVALGAYPTEWDGSKLDPEDPAPTIGRYGYRETGG